MTSVSQPPFPPIGGYLNAIRETSQSLREASGISIKSDGVKRLLLSPIFTQSFKRVCSFRGLAFPLKFASYLDELNLLSVLALLNFGSGYQIPLHAQTGHGADDSIKAFVFSLYITSSTGEGDLLSAKGMAAIKEGKVAELLGVSVHVEKPHDTLPGVTVGELAGPTYEFVKLVTGTLNETGTILVDSSYPNFGSFVLEALQEGDKAKSVHPYANAEVVLERIVRAFPAFRDMAVVQGQPIYIFKKALFLINAISARFGSVSPPLFPIPSTNQLSICADNILPSLLVHLGVIDVSASPSLKLLWPPTPIEKLAILFGPSYDGPEVQARGGPVLNYDQAYSLRAAAVDACQQIYETSRTIDLHHVESLEWIRSITLPQIGMWLWSISKDRQDYRALERMVFTNTIFF